MSEIATLHIPFADFLRKKGIPFVNPRSDRESTIAKGHPDFTLCARNRLLLIEMKTKEGKLSREQKERIAELDAAGNTVHVIRDLSTAIELVNAWHSTLGEIREVEKQRPRLVSYGSQMWEERNGQLFKPAK